MDFKTSQKLYSVARMGKYQRACSGDKRKTMQLYRYNLRLCQRFYGVLSLFEVMLRNAINAHYSAYFNDYDWIINQADTGKLLAYNKDEIRQTEAGYRRRGIYNNDKMVASLTMGFWTKLFSKKRYKRGGKTLLQIFPNKANLDYSYSFQQRILRITRIVQIITDFTDFFQIRWYDNKKIRENP